MAESTLYEHPEYKRMRDQWQLYCDLYDGNHATIASKYLWYHGLERKLKDADAQLLRATRVERTRYLNFPEIIISLWTSIFFREEPVPDEKVKDLLGDAIDDIDGFGTSLYGFVKDKLLKSYLLYGSAYVLCDAFPFQARTAGEAKDRGVRPYLELLEPLSVPDWDIETQDSKRLGKFNILRHEFDIVEPRMTAAQEPKSKRVCNELRVQDGRYIVQVYTADYDTNLALKKSTTGEVAYIPGALIETDLDEIPISYVKGDSWIKDVAQETLRHYNLRSNLDNVNYYQGYQKIFIKGVDGNDEEQRRAMSSYVVSYLRDKDSDVIFGEPVNTTSLESAIAQSVSSIFKLGLNQLRHIAQDSKESQSSEAQSAEREYTVAQVEAGLDDIETCINSALKQFAKFKGNDNFDGKYELNKDIDREDVNEWLRVYMSFKDELTQNYPEVNREAVKKAISKLKLANEDELLEGVDSAPLPEPEVEREDLIAQIARGQSA